jgi:hypothetical protein
MSWLNRTTTSESSAAWPHSCGHAVSISSAGVVNCHCTGLAISVPLVDFSPAATAAVYVVEYGRRPSASNAIICVPSHLNLPRGCGEIDIGERSSLRSSTDASGTIA